MRKALETVRKKEKTIKFKVLKKKANNVKIK